MRAANIYANTDSPALIHEFQNRKKASNRRFHKNTPALDKCITSSEDASGQTGSHQKIFAGYSWPRRPSRFELSILLFSEEPGRIIVYRFNSAGQIVVLSVRLIANRCQPGKSWETVVAQWLQDSRNSILARTHACPHARTRVPSFFSLLYPRVGAITLYWGQARSNLDCLNALILDLI